MPRTKSSRQLDREIADALWQRGRNCAIGHRLPVRHHARRPWKGTEVQALLFERPRWTPTEAKAWAKDHDFNSGKVHVTDNYVRLRQFDPTRGRQKRTITFGDGIKAVIEQVK